MSQQHPVNHEHLLALVQEIIVNHPDYFTGLGVDDVEQNGDVLVFRGNYYLDDQSLPTAMSTTVFNVYKALAVNLSARYRLEK
ncbi:DUF2498 family protein [Candidatus Erwinia dacicola]|uniref:Protein YciN n=1 Tax=Candidatus Erwinia dacicola TaxID=252393 RepID=A0A1E7Z255_9GAMM|nr:DUF2498 family protein [Candidatus Erwinia dacicola]NJD85450.1 DUF2498 family protein [Candidatus Erwinia dacicola]OFC62849.1 hypothetical protein BBW68_07900 [Candidatus Erwinia dacicola]RAP72074.1 protein YciN [Candidatus Erwinia dacicola]